MDKGNKKAVPFKDTPECQAFMSGLGDGLALKGLGKPLLVVLGLYVLWCATYVVILMFQYHAKYPSDLWLKYLQQDLSPEYQRQKQNEMNEREKNKKRTSKNYQINLDA